MVYNVLRIKDLKGLFFRAASYPADPRLTILQLDLIVNDATGQINDQITGSVAGSATSGPPIFPPRNGWRTFAAGVDWSG